MLYRLRSSGEIKSKSDIIKLKPNTSLPREWKAATYDFFGVDPIKSSRPFAPSSEDKIVVENGIEQNAEGDWVTAWVEQDKYASEEEKAADAAAAISVKSIEMREKRDEMLSRTDWMALSDVTMSAEWRAYRQALRDIPEQEGFPDNVVWPTKPE